MEASNYILPKTQMKVAENVWIIKHSISEFDF